MLRGSSNPELPLTAEDKIQLLDWVNRNAQDHWLKHQGPLRPRWEGGVDVVIISDPSLTPLALISKQQDFERPVIFDSRVDIHERLPGMVSGPQSEAFGFIWSTLCHADVFACQAPTELDSCLVPRNKVGYVMASVDRYGQYPFSRRKITLTLSVRFDAIAKDMTDWDSAFYGRQLNASLRALGTATIDIPNGQIPFPVPQNL